MSLTGVCSGFVQPNEQSIVFCFYEYHIVTRSDAEHVSFLVDLVGLVRGRIRVIDLTNAFSSELFADLVP